MAIDSYGFFTGRDYFIGWMSGSRKWRISYRYPTAAFARGIWRLPRDIISGSHRKPGKCSKGLQCPQPWRGLATQIIPNYLIASLALSIADRVTVTCICSRCPSSLPTMPTYEKQEFADFEAFELAMQDWALQGEMELTYNTAVCVHDVVHFPNEEHTGNCLGAAPIHRGRSSRPSWLQRAPFRSQRR